MTALDIGPAAHILRAGHWKHEWIPLDPAAASEKFHGHVPAGWKPPHAKVAEDVAAKGTPQTKARWLLKSYPPHPDESPQDYRRRLVAKVGVYDTASKQQADAYMRQLREQLAKPKLGQLRPASWTFLSGEGVRELGEANVPGRAAAYATIAHDLDRAAESVRKGNLSDARNRFAFAQKTAQKAGLRTVAADLAKHAQALHVDVLTQEPASRHDAFVESTREICRAAGLRLD